MKLSILIPAFDEAGTIEEVLRRVAAVDTASHGFEKEVVVCVDGGADGTFERATTAAAPHGWTVVRHPHNRGKGAAIRTALAHATGEFAIVQDADLEYDFGVYPGVLRALASGARAVYGSRFLERRWPARMRPTHLVANKLLTATANALYGHRITDEATCVKAIETGLLRAMALECVRFEFCPEVTAKLGLRGVPIVEVPVAYEARSVAAGKKIRWTDGAQALWVLLKLRAR